MYAVMCTPYMPRLCFLCTSILGPSSYSIHCSALSMSPVRQVKVKIQGHGQRPPRMNKRRVHPEPAGLQTTSRLVQDNSLSTVTLLSNGLQTRQTSIHRRHTHRTSEHDALHCRLRQQYCFSTDQAANFPHLHLSTLCLLSRAYAYCRFKILFLIGHHSLPDAMAIFESASSATHLVAFSSHKSSDTLKTNQPIKHLACRANPHSVYFRVQVEPH
ncbi:hypothetical protein BKA67DRAFT_205305 [Truncatella angustata]|uniref:Uncharacterized protein n=1 Tax=Truncatella angustata TaxID=152316 RepID=A0A9P9A181_9PEZI|nr:uncharacterized protein BKA67DRAFT_205305 [Truncatella angustata]KAH6658053.1 hypothetical protein BKA67DRAFT_205305 [Truncatella angustata]